MVYSYVVTSQKSTAVNHSIICKFTSETDCNLILAKGHHLEIHTLREDGLVADLDIALYGNIISLESYRPSSLLHDVIFILTDKKLFCVLGYDAVNRKVITRAVGSVKDRVGRESQCGQRGFIDPDNRMIGMLLYENCIKMVPMEAHGLKEAFNLSLDETRLLDLTFLHGCSRPTLCLLYEDSRKARHVKTLVVDQREKELVAGPWAQGNVEYAASKVIAVPSPLNGVILVGAMSLTYVNGSGTMQSVEITPTQVTAWARINADGSRYLLGDHRGNLMVLVLSASANHRVTSLVVDYLGTTSIAKTLNYLDNGVVFVGSAYGDSQLIKLHSSSSAASSGSSSGNCFEVLDTYQNLGPVVDMCLADNERTGGQRQIVACSGAYKDGSLKIVRSGIGIQEQASLEVSGIKGTWSLRPSESSEFDKYLVQSFIGETRILCIDNEELAETEFEGFSSQQPSLYCGNMLGGTMVQVTPTSVRLVDGASFALLDEYLASKSITVASGNLLQVAFALTGGELLCLQIDTATHRKLVLVSSVTLDQDVACISLRPLESAAAGRSAAATTAYEAGEESMDVEVSSEDVSALGSSLVAVGMWTDNSVRLLALPTLDEVCRVSLGTDIQARDVLLAELGGRAFLLVGLGDGRLVTYVVELNGAEGGLPTLTNKRKGVLGTHAISFSCFRNAGELCVFASCDRPTVIYARNGKLLFSVINASKVEISGMSPFHSELFPSCLAMVSESSLLIGTIEDIQKLHVQSIPLGEAPRRIAYNATVGVYGVCTEKVTATERGEESVCRVLFFEEGNMSRLGSFELDRLEQATSIATGIFLDAKVGAGGVGGAGSDTESVAAGSSSSAAATGKSSAMSTEYFIVGTAQVVSEEVEPSRGRILLFEITADKRVLLVTEKAVKGAVFSMAIVQGKLAACISSKVELFSYHSGDSNTAFAGQPELRSDCVATGYIMALFIKARGDKLLVGDIVRSLSLLQLRDSGLGDAELADVARDFNSAYILGVEVLEGGDCFLGADDHGNLFSVHQQTDAVSDEDRCRLETDGEFNLGDFVNVFRRGTLVGQPIEPESVAHATASQTSPNRKKAAVAGVFGAGSVLENNYVSVTGYSAQTESVLYGTVSGALGSVIPLTEDSFRFFGAVEKAMTHVSTPVGGLTHADWRGFSNTMRSAPQRGMLDGDLIEMALDLSSDDLDVVTRDVNEILNNYVATSSGANKIDGAINTESMGVLMKNLDTEKICLTAEDIIRRVEDIARLH